MSRFRVPLIRRDTGKIDPQFLVESSGGGGEQVSGLKSYSSVADLDLVTGTEIGTVQFSDAGVDFPGESSLGVEGVSGSAVVVSEKYVVPYEYAPDGVVTVVSQSIGPIPDIANNRVDLGRIMVDQMGTGDFYAFPWAITTPGAESSLARVPAPVGEGRAIAAWNGSVIYWQMFDSTRAGQNHVDKDSGWRDVSSLVDVDDIGRGTVHVGMTGEGSFMVRMVAGTIIIDFGLRTWTTPGTLVRNLGLVKFSGKTGVNRYAIPHPLYDSVTGQQSAHVSIGISGDIELLDTPSGPNPVRFRLEYRADDTYIPSLLPGEPM